MEGLHRRSTVAAADLLEVWAMSKDMEEVQTTAIRELEATVWAEETD